MAEVSSPPEPTADVPGPAHALPEVRLEYRHGKGRLLAYEVSEAGFLIGSVPGCDLRLPGTGLPPVLCMVVRGPAGPRLRKLAPTYPLLVNGKTLTSAPIANGDRITLGQVDLVVRVSNAPGTAHSQPPVPSAAEQEQVQAVRQELAALRQELYDRYRQRRDRLAGLQEAVNNAAAKVQERKRQLDAESQNAAAVRQEDETRRAELDSRAQELARARELLDEDRCRMQAAQNERQEELTAQAADLQARQEQIARERHELEQRQAQYQADVLRLDRWGATLEQRQKQLEGRAVEMDGRYEQMKRDSRDMEEQARQLDEWHAKLTQQAQEASGRSTDLDVRHSDILKRTNDLETQQAALASLRTRLEREREEVRRAEARLGEQRSRQEQADLELDRKAEALGRQEAELAVKAEANRAQGQRCEERAAELEQAKILLREQAEKLAAEEEQLGLRAAALDTRAADLTQSETMLKARSDQLLEMQDRLAADRNVLRDREAELGQAETARAALQEQLRRRGEELAERFRAIAERERELAETAGEQDARRQELERDRQQIEAKTGLDRQDLDSRDRELEDRQGQLGTRERDLVRQIEKLREMGVRTAALRKELHEERERWQSEKSSAEAIALEKSEEFGALRAEAGRLAGLIPEWETRVQSAAHSLSEVRDRLRQHLGEFHAYVQSCQGDLAARRTALEQDAERQRQYALALHRARDEHRLAVAAFRQQLIEWQSQVADMKRAMSQDESRLAERRAEVDATSARLAEQAEKLQVQEKEVSERRGEMERHLDEMREWYRRKLRELSEKHRQGDGEPVQPALAGTAAQPSDAAPPRADILALTGDVDPADRGLGDLLQSLELIEADTLSALLIEARKQRQSLRQVLLASGYVTLYQLALIEAGNLDALVMGPVRVLDRLRVTPRETVYRVFDPRRPSGAPAAGEANALLRCLADAELDSAAHPDEFRQRFAAAAALHHPNLAAVFEVLDVRGRPTALVEWVHGVPATDWPPLAGVSGVWFRLVCQAGLALQTAHRAGLIHGHLTSEHLVLTADGTLKITGLGEPPWLASPDSASANEATAEPGTRDDLLALGGIAQAWTAAAALGRKGARSKPLAAPLKKILARVTSHDDKSAYESAAALLEDLDQVSDQIPPNPEAWERLLHFVSEADSQPAGARRAG